MRRLFILSIIFILPLQIFAQTEMWVARYNGSVSVPGAYDAAYAMVVDDSGYIYVTGESCDTAWSDYMTIKYNSSGDTVWVRKYNGPDNLDDAAYAIAVDKSGNVYVTGASVGNGTDYDYATVKYNSAGDKMWVRRYGSGSGTGSKYDVGRALALDSIGNVYVTGTSNGNGYATIKYNSLGDTMWVRIYGGSNEANAISVDPNGNVYVTGTSVGSGNVNDYATIKYNSVGDTMWVRRYRKPGYIDNEANAIAVDNSGNVYITGISSSSFSSDTISEYATIKYNSLGDTVWVRTYSGTAKGYKGPTYNETITVNRGKNNKSLAYKGATALALDSNGNVYVTGKSYSAATYYDYATIKYNSVGDTIWVRRYNGTGDSTDCARGIAVDNIGNVYVTGNSWGVGSVYGEDYATIKYSSSGSEEWVQRYNGPGNRTDDAYSIAVDNNGYVYVTGKSAGGGYDYVTIKYSTVGAEEKWSEATSRLGGIELTVTPNPFTSTTVISYSGIVNRDSKTNIKIYDIAGKLVEETKNNTIGGKLKSGIYFVKVNDYLTADRHVKLTKIVKISYVK
ncbi:MAG: SBBP repeat-containing protein [bacterium]|nr:SBBP repeat-containing protein [bacterium]